MENLDLLDDLLGLDPGWASAPEIVHNLAPTEPHERARARRLLTALARSGVLESMTVRHQGDGMKLYRLDPAAVEAARDEVEP